MKIRYLCYCICLLIITSQHIAAQKVDTIRTAGKVSLILRNNQEYISFQPKKKKSSSNRETKLSDDNQVAFSRNGENILIKKFHKDYISEAFVLNKFGDTLVRTTIPTLDRMAIANDGRFAIFGFICPGIDVNASRYQFFNADGSPASILLGGNLKYIEAANFSPSDQYFVLVGRPHRSKKNQNNRDLYIYDSKFNVITYKSINAKIGRITPIFENDSTFILVSPFKLLNGKRTQSFYKYSVSGNQISVEIRDHD